jgi:hypothetical protein
VTIPVLIILGALWAAVLVPPLLRAHSDSKSTTIGDLSNKLGVLNKNRSSIKLKTSTYSSLVPHRGPVKPLNTKAKSAKRKKEVLLVLSIACAVTFVIAFFTSNIALWVLNIVIDICLASYIYILLKLEEIKKQHHKSLNKNKKII